MRNDQKKEIAFPKFVSLVFPTQISILLFYNKMLIWAGKNAEKNFGEKKLVSYFL